MDPFVIVVLGAGVVVAGWAWFVNRCIPGSGSQELGLRSARTIVEEREALEADDVGQMQAALEALRARRPREGTGGPAAGRE